MWICGAPEEMPSHQLCTSELRREISGWISFINDIRGGGFKDKCG